MDVTPGQELSAKGRNKGSRTLVPGRPWPAVRTGLAWSGAVLFPAVTYVTFSDGQQGFDLLMVLASLVLAAVVASLLRRRPLPALTLLLLGGVTATMEMRTSEVSYLQVFAGVCAVGYLAAARPRRTSVTAAVLAFTAQMGSLFGFPPDTGCLPGEYGMRNCSSSAWADDSGQSAVLVAVLLIAAWMAGSSARERRTHAEALRSQATARAVTAERLRIARELHDMIAHSIGVIAIQAGVGSRVIDTQPAEARNALATIEATSRETLAGLRRTLVALRRPESESEPGADGGTLDPPRDTSAPPPREPAPGLADVDRLAASARDAGVHAEIRRRGESGPLPADIDLAAFRILQEALTNVVRHAGTDTCRVTVERRDGELSLEIEDDGRGGLPAGTGFGLVGMRERVALLHGRFTAGPRPEGGFRVTALLPLPPVEAR
ncbi:sensor histidine kinase [Streptomyces durmitorensis]|uniref:histidine kinase n=1 Tax=Streptomyces durmitorensis TaxID=319947 RepID=A0ABY4PZY7_9ACTN|nr:sensor histidine kinase [Streptomyces durmitorensis]UQT59490.1 sensor histidine kinase [Streptomyces durmitorensis]